MDALVVVVDPESNGFMEFGNISIFRSLAELELELAEPALDKAVLPGAALARAAQADLQLAAKLPLPVRKILAALVGMEDRWRSVFAQGIQERAPSQPGAVVASQPPADDPPAAEIHHNRQITEAGGDSQVSEVLNPGIGSGHCAVVPAVLGSA